MMHGQKMDKGMDMSKMYMKMEKKMGAPCKEMPMKMNGMGQQGKKKKMSY